VRGSRGARLADHGAAAGTELRRPELGGHDRGSVCRRFFNPRFRIDAAYPFAVLNLNRRFSIGELGAYVGSGAIDCQIRIR
jgi:hypothetical protein